MKKSRYNDEQIVRILREADRESVPEVAKRHGVSEASIYAWRKRFGEMVRDDVKRLKALEAENVRLKKLVADQALVARNSVWCYDFVFDACANGQQVKCLTVVDEYTRECLAIDVAGSIRSSRVVEVHTTTKCARIRVCST